MIRRYCDACGDRISNDENLAQDLIFSVGTDKPLNGFPQQPVSVSVSVHRTGASARDVCLNCVRRTVAEGLATRAQS